MASFTPPLKSKRGLRSKSPTSFSKIRATVILTALACGALASSGSFAGTEPQIQVGETAGWQWSLSHVDGTNNYIASVKRIDKTAAITGSVDKTFSQQDFESLQGNGTDPVFAQNINNDLWSVVAGAEVKTGDINPVTWDNASINIKLDSLKTTTADLPITVLGVTVSDGNLTFTGDSTTISAENAAADPQGGKWEDAMNAAGVYLDNDFVHNNAAARKINFNAAKTSISSTVDEAANGLSLGLGAVMNTATQTLITFDSDTTITAVNKSSAQKNGYGIWMDYSDARYGGTEENPVRHWGTVGNLSFASGKSLTVNAEGHSAVGVMVDVGLLTVGGSATITSSGANNAYGMLVRGHGEVTLNGETTISVNNPGTSNHVALVLELDGAKGLFHEDWTNGYESMENPGPKVTLNGNTTLNGGLQQGTGTTLVNNGTLTVNNDFVTSGTISGTGTLVVGNGTVSGNIAQTSLQVVDGTLTVAEGGHIDSEVLEVTRGTFVETGSSTHKITVLHEGGVFTGGPLGENNSLTLQANTWEFDGGHIKGTNGDLKNVALQKEGADDGDDPSQGGNVVWKISSGDYSYDSFTINLAKATDPHLKVHGGSLKVGTFTAGEGDAEVLTGGVLNVDKLVSTGVFDITAKGGTFKVGTYTSTKDGAFLLNDGTLEVTKLDLSAGGTLNIGAAGTLQTSSEQIFTKGLGAEGTVADAEGLKYGSQVTFEAQGSLALTDKLYNDQYSASVHKLVGADTQIVWKGEKVDAVNGKQSLDDIQESNDVHDNVTATVGSADANNPTQATVNKTVGVQGLEVTDANVTTVAVAQDKQLTLVGNKDGGEVISFASKDDTSVKVDGTVKLGAANSSNNTGTLSSAVTVSDGGTLAVETGSFKVADVTAETGATISSANGAGTFTKVALNGGTLAATGEKATQVDELHVNDTTNASTLTGTVTTKLTGKDGAVLNVGSADEKTSAKADLQLHEDSALNGMIIFIDPAWKDGVASTDDASRLVVTSQNVDGRIVAGQNSYAVLGTDNDQAFKQLFADKVLTWGKDNTGAALFVGAPIKLDKTNGALQANASLTTAPSALAAGSLLLAANTVLVADMTQYKDAAALISGVTTLTVDKAAQAVIVGTLENGKTYKLTDAADLTSAWTQGQIIAGNKMWKLDSADGNSFTAKLEDAKLLYGNLMQGAALANAGMAANNAYVNQLLTDASNTLSNAQIAERFDAAMNPGGSLAVFTTAYDRASELRQVVREQADTSLDNHLWAHVTGGKTKLKGISTGGQSLHTDTDVYGLVIGGDAKVGNGVVGAALTAGTGKTENDAVAGKDDFNYYGVSVYGKTTVGSVDVLGDISATWLKSDLTVGNGAAVDTDTTTSVYSAGVTAQKTFALGVDVTPFVGLDLYHVRGGSYSNGHGADVESANATAVEIPVGAKISKAFATNSGMKVAPEFSFAVVPTLGSKDVDSKVRLAGAESTYNFTYADDVKLRSRLGVKAEKENFTFGLNAGYEWGNEERSAASLQANVKYRF